jgi:hypothetical protein
MLKPCNKENILYTVQHTSPSTNDSVGQSQHQLQHLGLAFLVALASKQTHKAEPLLSIILTTSSYSPRDTYVALLTPMKQQS